ncbi:MAG: hypothetical protein KAW40_06130 [Candidatus Aenigmarchaeota archaeon]|nr:hypothetical protein [Candidatus Aenigmarchaeota archaeon]
MQALQQATSGGLCGTGKDKKVIPLRDCQKTLKRELARQKVIYRRGIIKLEAEIDKLKNSNK